MWPFGKKARLIRALERLAFYNDKGAAYARHSETQVHEERASRVARIWSLVELIGQASFPPGFLADLRGGAVAMDISGDYTRLLRAHFRRRADAL